MYDGAQEGLVTAEIEFPSLEASEGFAPPQWIGREVTGDARYANQSLALAGARRPTPEQRSSSGADVRPARRAAPKRSVSFA